MEPGPRKTCWDLNKQDRLHSLEDSFRPGLEPDHQVCSPGPALTRDHLLRTQWNRCTPLLHLVTQTPTETTFKTTTWTTWFLHSGLEQSPDVRRH